MHVLNDNLIVNRHQHIHTLLRDYTCLNTSYINHVPRIVIWIVLEKTSTAPPFHSLHRRSFVEPTEIQSNCWLPHGMSGSQQLKVPPVGHFDFEADVVSSKKIVVSAECCEQCEFRIESKWCKAHISTVESEIRPSFRNSELLKGASKWYPGKLRYETSACLATLEPVVKKRKMANVQHRILACPRSTLHLHYRHLMP